MILFPKKKLHIFGIKTSPLGSCCSLYNELCETSFHIFHECDRVKCLRSNLVQCFQNNLILPTFTPQIAIFEFPDFVNNNSVFENNKVLSNNSINT